MMRLKWNILIYSMLFVVVLYLVLNDSSPILIVGVTIVAVLIAFTIQFYYPAVLDKRVDRVESFCAAKKAIRVCTSSMLLQTNLRTR